MSPTRAHELVVRMAPIVARAMTDAGHLAQVVPWEHRGTCRHDACTPDCLAAQQVATDLLEYLKETQTMAHEEVAG